MCFRCARPMGFCHCSTVPTIANRIELLLAQHIRERSHPFNTARMVRSAFTNVVSVIDYAEKMSHYDHLIRPGAALLFPGRSASLLNTEIETKPSQLVVLDGTWNQAKRLFNCWPKVRELPQYRLAPSEPGKYQIRLEPNRHSLSTVEAVVAAWKVLEPALPGLDELSKSFGVMVANQLSHPNAHYKRSSEPRPSNINAPNSLVADFDRLVVAYGEAATGPDGRWDREIVRPPVYWVAQRPATSETFSTFLTPPFPVTQKYLSFFELEPAHLDNGCDVKTFRDRWNEFFNQGDILVVYNRSTIRLLGAAGIETQRKIELKSINFDPHNCHASFAEMFKSQGVVRTAIEFPGRAGLRLANAVTIVEMLRNQMEYKNGS